MPDTRFEEKPLNGCSGCGQDFTSTQLFDAHRTGVYVYSLEQGLKLDPPCEDGRRCLDADEMTAKGWELNDRGRWLEPVKHRPSEGSGGRITPLCLWPLSAEFCGRCERDERGVSELGLWLLRAALVDGCWSRRCSL